jgi:hypothetical protein
VLAHPVLTDPFELEVDVSGYAMGAVLLQKKEDGKKHPIVYYSKTLSAAERNYDVYDLELLAIVNAMDHWRPYLACHGSAGTPLGTHANGEDSGLEESCAAIRT